MIKKFITSTATMLILSYSSLFSQNNFAQVSDAELNIAQTKMSNTMMKNHPKPMDNIYHAWYQYVSPNYDTSLIDIKIKDPGNLRSFDRNDDTLFITKTPVVNDLFQNPIQYNSSRNKNADVVMPIIVGILKDPSYTLLFN